MFTPTNLARIVHEYAYSFDPAAENTCEALLARALNVSPGNAEALQALASVRMSQSRPDDAKALLEQSWSSWKELDAGMFFLLLAYYPQCL